MDIFQRSIHSNVKRLDEDRLLVFSTLLDLEHSFHLEIVVRSADGTIETARATMSKTPLSGCQRALDSVSELQGLQVGRGIVRAVHHRFGGPRGCAHLVELMDSAIRLVAMLLTGDSLSYWSELKATLSEEEIVAQGRERLPDTCLVFARCGTDRVVGPGRDEGP